MTDLQSWFKVTAHPSLKDSQGLYKHETDWTKGRDYMVGTRICMLAMILTLDITGFLQKYTAHWAKEKNALDK